MSKEEEENEEEDDEEDDEEEDYDIYKRCALVLNLWLRAVGPVSGGSRRCLLLELSQLVLCVSRGRSWSEHEWLSPLCCSGPR